MPENIGSERYRAEISMLSREIHRLNHQLEQANKPRHLNKYAPFENPTDYPNFSGDYSVILPQLDSDDYTIPLEPTPSERKKLRRYYSIGGWCAVFQFVCSNIIIQGLMLLVSYLLGTLNSDAGSRVISSYMRSTSIFAGMNMLTYMLVNITFAFLGLKIAKIRKMQLVRTRNFSFGKAVQYCFIGSAIWVAAALLSSGVSDVFSKYGYSTDIMDLDGFAETGIGFAVMTIYTCLIAPVTEEIFFRGMLLRVFSKANQRFAVFASAFFFGLAHGNIPQFLLAFLLGIFLAHITLKHNSVIPSTIVHIFINSMVTLIGKLTENAGNEELLIIEFAIMLAAILGAFILFIFLSNDRLPATTPAQSRRGFAVAKGSIPFMSAIILQVIYLSYLILVNI